MTAPLFLQDRSQCMSYLTEVKGSVFDLRTSTQTVSHWRTSRYPEVRGCTLHAPDPGASVHIAKFISLFEDQGIILSAVVIKSDSEYLVRGVTEWLPKWKRNGWKNSRGLDVANWEHFKAIERLTEDLERHKLTIKFWHVPRRNNRDADTMAKAVLRGAWNRGLGLLPPF
ncbi:hypothetical protein ACP6JD_000386 [Aspergillus fumigatus]